VLKSDMEGFMESTTHLARVTARIPFPAGSERKQSIPIGPCLIERLDDQSAEIIWGTHGQSSVVLPFDDIKAAQNTGHLMFLD